MKLRPTHRCFNDALELLVEWLRQEPRLANEMPPSVFLVHGICTDSEDRHLYAHAWLERDGVCFNGAFDETRGERVYVEVDRMSFHALFGVVDANFYSIRRAWAENARSGHYGPWTKEHQKLCGKPGSLVKPDGTLLDSTKRKPEAGAMRR